MRGAPRTPLAAIALLVAVLSGCGGGDTGPESDGPQIDDDGSGDTNETGCTRAAEKRHVSRIMQEWYFWNDEAAQADKYADLDRAAYDDASDLLDFLRYRPDSRDRGFSHLTTPEEEQAFFGEGQYIGFGFSFLSDGAGDIRISQVYAGSPAADAGMERGYTLLAIDGADVRTMSNAGVSEALGPSEEGVSRTLQLADRDGGELPPMELTKRTVTIDPVPVATVLRDEAGVAVAGYLVLRTFISPAESALREAFADFQSAGIDRLIVDLRYNGGGRVDTAALFASLLAGPANSGNVFIDFEYNSDKAAANNRRQVFELEPNALNIDTLVFITTNFSASASELVISGLQPWFTGGKDLASIGSTTFGKPVGQSAFDFCNGTQRLRAVTFKSVNADGRGDYFNGLPVDCPAGDDLQAPFGAEDESMLSAALNYIETGRCATAAGRRTIASQADAGDRRLVGGPAPWQRYAGAY